MFASDITPLAGKQFIRWNGGWRELTINACPVSSAPAAANFELTIKEPKPVFALVMAEVGPLLFYLQFLTLCSVVADQSGLVGASASTFIDWSIQNGIATEDYMIAWVKEDTTDSITYFTVHEMIMNTQIALLLSTQTAQTYYPHNSSLQPLVLCSQVPYREDAYFYLYLYRVKWVMTFNEVGLGLHRLASAWIHASRAVTTAKKPHINKTCNT